MIKTLNIKNVAIGEGRTKIAVSIIGKTREDILKDIDYALKSRCDIIEWRADFYEDIMDFNELRSLGKSIMEKCQKKPVIFTFRTIEEGGEKAISLSEYRSLLKVVSEEKLADIIDVEAFFYEDVYINDEILHIIEDIKACNIAVLVSNHNFMETPPQVEIVARLMGMQKLGADIVKMAVMPSSKYDVITMLSATEDMVSNYSTVPVVSIAMGKEGIISRVGGEFAGSAISFAALKTAAAPGQINVNELFIMLDKFHRAYGNYSGSEIEAALSNIFLVGYMGVGKTAVSKVLSDIKGMEYVDTDDEIVKCEGKSIPEIFDENSEEYFREVETKILKNISKKKGQIVSCGGGIVLKDENIDIMKQNGIIIWLDASPELVYERVSDDPNRPLMKGKKLEDIRDMMNKRRKQYEKAADFVIDTENMLIQDICSEILEVINE